MSQRFAQPSPIRVVSDEQGRPAALFLRRGREPVRVCNYWRAEGDWWRRGYAREYYQLLTRSGTVCLVYRDADGVWYLQKTLD